MRVPDLRTGSLPAVDDGALARPVDETGDGERDAAFAAIFRDMGEVPARPVLDPSASRQGGPADAFAGSSRDDEAQAGTEAVPDPSPAEVERARVPKAADAGGARRGVSLAEVLALGLPLDGREPPALPATNGQPFPPPEAVVGDPGMPRGSDPAESGADAPGDGDTQGRDADPEGDAGRAGVAALFAQMVPFAGKAAAPPGGAGPQAPAAAPAGQVAPETAPAAATAIQVVVLARETHFAPVRSFVAREPFDDPRAGPAPLPPAEAAAGVSDVPDGAHVAPPVTRREDRTGEDTPREGHDEPTPVAVRSQGSEVRDASPEHRSRGVEPVAAAAPTAGAGRVSGEVSVVQPVTVVSLPSVSLTDVGEAIAAEVARLTPAEPVDSVPGAPRAAGPVRVLEIALTPEDLGRVVVRLRLTSTGLEVNMRAGNAATARLLEQDREALAHVLRRAGIEAARITVVGEGAPITFATGLDGAPRTPSFAAPQDTAQPDGDDGSTQSDRRRENREGQGHEPREDDR